MGRLTRDTLLAASDLSQREIELPTLGGSVVIRSLPAAYANQAQSEAMEQVQQVGRREQVTRINMQKLEALQVLHGLVEPKLNSLAEAEQFAKQCGPAWNTLVQAINEASGINNAEVERVNAQFPDGGTQPGNGGATEPLADGAGVG